MGEHLLLLYKTSTQQFGLIVQSCKSWSDWPRNALNTSYCAGHSCQVGTNKKYTRSSTGDTARTNNVQESSSDKEEIADDLQD